jgi:hypothetical protein
VVVSKHSSALSSQIESTAGHGLKLQKIRRAIEAWMRSVDYEGDNEPYLRPYSDAAVWRCVKRSFIVTEKGYMGLGPSRTQSGDVVCVLRGGNVPFILRESQDRYYMFVGESYVHGIMDGSFVREAKMEDMREFRIR